MTAIQLTWQDACADKLARSWLILRSTTTNVAFRLQPRLIRVHPRKGKQRHEALKGAAPDDCERPEQRGEIWKGAPVLAVPSDHCQTPRREMVQTQSLYPPSSSRRSGACSRRSFRLPCNCRRIPKRETAHADWCTCGPLGGDQSCCRSRLLYSVCRPTSLTMSPFGSKEARRRAALSG